MKFKVIKKYVVFALAVGLMLLMVMPTAAMADGNMHITNSGTTHTYGSLTATGWAQWTDSTQTCDFWGSSYTSWTGSTPSQFETITTSWRVALDEYDNPYFSVLPSGWTYVNGITDQAMSPLYEKSNTNFQSIAWSGLTCDYDSSILTYRGATEYITTDFLDGGSYDYEINVGLGLYYGYN